jgi:hypothetical protein
MYQTEAIKNCYSVWKFQDFSRKEKYLKNTKTTAIRPKNGKLLVIIFVVFKYFPFS